MVVSAKITNVKLPYIFKYFDIISRTWVLVAPWTKYEKGATCGPKNMVFELF